MRLSDDVGESLPCSFERFLPDCFAFTSGVTASTIPKGGTMEQRESKVLHEYVLHMCDSGWADEEATTEQGRAFLFRSNLVDDHLASFFGLSQGEVSTLAGARGAIACTGSGTTVELYDDATVLEEHWKELAR